MLLFLRKYSCVLVSLTCFLLEPAVARDSAVPPDVVLHQVQEQESPAEIADLYGVQLQQIQALNGEEAFGAGSLVQIPVSSADWPVHTVESGQTLWRIGKGYGITVDQLVQANQLRDTNLMPGQRLRLPRATRPKWTSPPAPTALATAYPSQPERGSDPLELSGEVWVEIVLADGGKAWVRSEDLVVGSWRPKDRLELIDTAREFIGTPYKWGGTNPNGYDCSGYVQEVFRLSGHSVPRMADAQYEKLQKVDTEALEPGDLVFFNTDGSGVSHVGIYSGDGKFLHASSSRGVIESELTQSYYAERYVGGARVETL